MTEKELNAYELGRKAGRDEAVEKIVNTIASKPYAFDLAEERLQVLQAIKALQDNK